MHTKLITSLVVAAVGIILVIYALSAMGRISDAKEKIHGIGDIIGKESAIGKFFRGELNKKASKYDTMVLVLLIVGGVFTVVGCGGAYFYRKRRK